MTDVQTRGAASRGRGSARGGRGGFAGRGARPARTNGDKENSKADMDHTEDEGDISELRKLYGNKVSLVKDVFPDWSEIDILFALQETDGDGDMTVTRIMDGTISQWGEVSKPKKTARAKAKDAPAGATNDSHARPPRGNRNVSDSGRGGRTRGSERGGRASRGRAPQAATNGHRSKEPLSVPTEEWGAHDSEKAETQPAEAEKTVETPKPAAAAPAQKTWASMLRQSTAPKPAPKPKEAPPPQPAEPLEPLPPVEAAAPEPEPTVEEPEPVAEQATEEEPKVVEPEIALPPPKDQLTETNLEQIIDTSQPAATGTAASTAADSWDPRQNAASSTATPLSASQQQHQTRPAVAPIAPNTTSGFATSAIKATTDRAVRTPSYRRKLDQEEAVRMPGNREVDRAAVQFGSLGLNGMEEDVDGDREEPETRAQPPDDSPVAHPRTSLPPVSQPTPVPEATPVQKPTATLPTPPAAPATVAAPAAPAAPPAPAAAPAPVQVPAPSQNTQQFNRYGQSGSSQESSSYTQKPFEPFGQQNQSAAQSQFESFPNQPSQPQTQQPTGAFSSAPSEFSNYYTADPQNRNQYNSYYSQQYGQQQHQQGQQAQQTQSGQGAQDSQPTQPNQRSFSGYNASQPDNLSQYPQSGLHQQSRYGAVSSDAHNSGHTTPNPSTQQGPGSQSQQHGQQPHSNYGAYNNHPYYNHPYYANYMYGQGGYNQSGYGGGPYGKGGMYGQPYGMSSSAPYDHSSSQVGGFGGGQSSLHRGNSGNDASLSSGLDNFSRNAGQTGSHQQGIGGSGYGGVHDPFGRNTAAAFQSQAGGQGFGNAAQPSAGSSNDDLKPFGDNKSGAGPSPSMGGARPGSATQNAPSGPAGLPPHQGSAAQMGGYGGYPSHLQHGGVHGGGYGMGGNAASGQQHNTPYSAYGGQGGFSSYYQQQGQGGQAGQQGGQGQQRGWGGNYH